MHPQNFTRKSVRSFGGEGLKGSGVGDLGDELSLNQADFRLLRGANPTNVVKGIFSLGDSGVGFGLGDLFGSIELGSKVDGLGVDLDVLSFEGDFSEPGSVVLGGGHGHDFGDIEFLSRKLIEKGVELEGFKENCTIV